MKMNVMNKMADKNRVKKNDKANDEKIRALENQRVFYEKTLAREEALHRSLGELLGRKKELSELLPQLYTFIGYAEVHGIGNQHIPQELRKMAKWVDEKRTALWNEYNAKDK